MRLPFAFFLSSLTGRKPFAACLLGAALCLCLAWAGASSAVPLEPDPADGAEEVAVDTSLDWEDDSTSSPLYSVYLWKGTENKPANPTASGLSQSQWKPGTDLDYSTSYSWQVVAQAHGEVEEGPLWSFETEAFTAPEQPENPTPAQDATAVSIYTHFDWDDTSRAVTYSLYLWKIGETKTLLQAGLTESEYQPLSPLENGKTYNWQVAAENEMGSTESETWTFSTEALPLPEAPKNPSPAPGATEVMLDTKLDWDNARDANLYDLYLWVETETDYSAADFRRPDTPTAANLTVSEYQPGEDLDKGTRYYWQVTAKNSSGETEGPVWNFLTELIPEAYGNVVIEVTPDEAEWVLEDREGNEIRGSGDQTVEDVPAGDVLLTWLPIPGYDMPLYNPKTATLVADGILTLTGQYSRQKGSVEIQVFPENAPWQLRDGENVLHRGTGDTVISDVPTGDIRLNWLEVEDYALPEPAEIARLLEKGEYLLFSATYPRHTGEVRIEVEPEALNWTLQTANGETVQGRGDQVISQVPTGQQTLVWGSVEGYSAPWPESGTLDLSYQQTLTFSQTLQLLPPGVPELIYPADGALSISRTPTLDWSVQGAHTSFDLYLWELGATIPEEPIASGLQASRYVLPWELSAAASYAWKVVVSNDAGQIESPVWSFSTATGQDNLQEALALFGPSGVARSSNTGAGKESGEPDHAGVPGGASIWWTWIANGDGVLIANTNGSAPDTVLAVYSSLVQYPSVTNLIALAGDDDSGDEGAAAVSLDVEKGRQYWFAVDGINGATGGITLRWELQPRADAWLPNFTPALGWQSQSDFPRFLADINGDGRDDMVGFGIRAVVVSLSQGNQLGRANKWSEDFTYKGGWDKAAYLRTVVDMTGDGKADLVGLGDKGVLVAPAATGNFQRASLWLADMGVQQGWTAERHPRLMGDVNGDNLTDIVGFGDSAVFVALNQGGTLTMERWLYDFGSEKGWSLDRHIRQLADMNQDGRDDVVGFGNNAVWVSLSTGSGFTAPTNWIGDFCPAQGWTLNDHPRFLADANGDHYPDIIGFGSSAVLVALNGGSGFLAPETWAGADMCAESGWEESRFPRLVRDMNGDGLADLLGFGTGGVRLSLSSGAAYSSPVWWIRDFGTRQGWQLDLHPRLIGNLDGDDLPEIVGFGRQQVFVY